MWLWSAKPLATAASASAAPVLIALGALEPAHDGIAMRAGAEAAPELPCELEARKASQLFKRRR